MREDSQVNTWLRLGGFLPIPQRAADVVVAAADAVREGAVDIHGVCAVAGVNRTVPSRWFGGDDGFMHAAAGLVVQEFLVEATADLKLRVEAAQYPADATATLDAWLHHWLLGPGSEVQVRPAIAVLARNRAGRACLGPAIAVSAREVAAVLRDWQARWLAPNWFDPLTRGTMLLLLLLGMRLAPAPMTRAPGLRAVIARFSASSANDGNARSLRLDSWSPNRRVALLDAPAERLDEVTEALFDGADAWLRQTMVRALRLSESTDLSEMRVGELCRELGVSTRSLYQRFDTATEFRWSVDAVWGVASWSSYVEFCAAAEKFDTAEEVERLFSDALQLFATPLRNALRVCRFRAVAGSGLSPRGQVFESLIVEQFERFSRSVQGLQERGVLADGLDPSALATMWFTHTVSRSICDYSEEKIPDANWGRESDLTFGGLLASSPSSLLHAVGNGLDLAFEGHPRT